MRPVTAESIRSRQTGQVGSSYILFCGGMNGAMPCETVSSVSIITERMRTTLQSSGYDNDKIFTLV